MALPAPTLAQSFGASTFAGGLNTLPSFVGLPFSAAVPAGKMAAKKAAVAASGVPFSAETLAIVAPAAISIALISVLETLLARKGVAAELKTDIADGQNERALCALSFGNTVSALFGGFGGCGLIPNTLLNLQSGGRRWVSGLAYSISLALFTLVAAPMIGAIPLASLAGVMLTVGLSTVQPEATVDGAKAALAGSPKAVFEFVALVATGLVCYFVDMAAGIGLGVLITLLGNLVTSK